MFYSLFFFFFFQDESTALHLASWYGHEKIVPMLLNYGAEVDAQDEVILYLIFYYSLLY